MIANLCKQARRGDAVMSWDRYNVWQDSMLLVGGGSHIEFGERENEIDRCWRASELKNYSK